MLLERLSQPMELSIFRSIMKEGYWHLENSMEIMFVVVLSFKFSFFDRESLKRNSKFLLLEKFS